MHRIPPLPHARPQNLVGHQISHLVETIEGFESGLAELEEHMATCRDPSHYKHRCIVLERLAEVREELAKLAGCEVLFD